MGLGARSGRTGGTWGCAIRGSPRGRWTGREARGRRNVDDQRIHQLHVVHEQRVLWIRQRPERRVCEPCATGRGQDLPGRRCAQYAHQLHLQRVPGDGEVVAARDAGGRLLRRIQWGAAVRRRATPNADSLRVRRPHERPHHAPHRPVLVAAVRRGARIRHTPRLPARVWGNGDDRLALSGDLSVSRPEPWQTDDRPVGSRSHGGQRPRRRRRHRQRRSVGDTAIRGAAEFRSSQAQLQLERLRRRPRGFEGHDGRGCRHRQQPLGYRLRGRRQRHIRQGYDPRERLYGQGIGPTVRAHHPAGQREGLGHVGTGGIRAHAALGRLALLRHG